LTAGVLKRRGFFDRIAEGDEIVPKDEPTLTATAPVPPPAADPELRAMLRRLLTLRPNTR
jgi:hypothetical protein